MTFTLPRPIAEERGQRLTERASVPIGAGDAWTHLVVGDYGLLAGYLALAATGIGRQRGPLNRDMPHSVPAVLLARLAGATGRETTWRGKAALREYAQAVAAFGTTE